MDDNNGEEQGRNIHQSLILDSDNQISIFAFA
jgi:hypothetical protein